MIGPDSGDGGAIRLPGLRFARESELRSRAARGDAAAFARVYEHHHQALYRYLRSLLRHDEDAQDALQSTMESAFAALRNERRDFELRPWLFRIAHNEAMTMLRRRRETAQLDETAAAISASVEEQVEGREVLRALQADLADLPERQRSVLILRELNGLGQDQIALVLGCSQATVQQALFEARSTLGKFREGRNMSCDVMRRALSNGDGRALRARHLRAHLRACPACREFRADLTTRPGLLSALIPPLPAGVAASLLRDMIDGTTAAAGTGWGMAVGGTGAALTAKAVAVVAVVATTAAVSLPARAPSERPATLAPAAVVAAPKRAIPASTAFRLKPAPRTTTNRESVGHTGAGTRAQHRASGSPAARSPGAAPATHVKSAPAAATEHTRRTQAPASETPRTAPGQAKKTEAPKVPPGQAKKTEAPKVPPGQAKKTEEPKVPPGQAKQAEGPALPPGQAKKVEGTPTEPETSAPGNSDSAPGQSKTPPGQSKKDGG